MLDQIKNPSTKKLISGLMSLEIIEPYNCIEFENYIDIQFKIAKENRELWFKVINRLVEVSNKLMISKRFIQVEGKLLFTWSIAIASETLDTDVELIYTQLTSQFNINPNKVIEPIVTRKPIRKPYIAKNMSKEGEIPILNASPKRNAPKPGSTKGVYIRDERGSGEAQLMKNFYQSKFRGLSE